MCIVKGYPNPTTERVWWRDDAQWVLYNHSNANSIKESLASGTYTVDLGIIQFVVHPNGNPYSLYSPVVVGAIIITSFS